MHIQEQCDNVNNSHINEGNLTGKLRCIAVAASTMVMAFTGSLALAQSGIGAVVPNTTLSFSAVEAASEPTVRWPNGEYQESNIDLRVKVLGGTLDIARTWSQGRWWLNPAWAPLNFELDPLGNEAKIIERAGVLYERSGQSGLYIAKTKGSASVFIKQLIDAQNQPQGWQWYDRFGNTINYDTTGRILSYANSSGVKVSFAYDSATTARILDHFDKTIYTVTMSGGLITKVEDLTGRSVGYQWNGNRLTQVTDVMGNLWKYEYDGNGQITSRTDPLGDKVTVQYSASVPAPAPMLALGMKGVIVSPAGTSGTTQKLANLWGAGRVGLFDGSGCSITGKNTYIREKRQFNVTYTDCRNNVTLYVYDLQGNQLSSTFNGKARNANTWDGEYVQKETSARGYSTTTQYDTNYQPLQITYPDGSVEKFTYEPRWGYKSSYTNQLGVLSTRGYDSKGNTTEWVEAKGLPEQRTTRYVYDQYGQLTSTTRGAGDAAGADAVTQSVAYDSAGNVTAQTDGEGHTRKTAFDQRGAPTSRTDALNRTTTFNFDAAGNLVKSTNPLDNATQMKYDARNRRTHVISPMGNTQVTRYDIEGRVIEVLAPGEKEGAGRRTVYDSNGWPTQSISPSGLITETSYDQEGRITSSKDPADNITSYSYGEDGTEQAGQLLATQYPTYKETYQYDQQGRKTAVTQHLGNNPTRVQGSTFDALGQQVASTDPAGRTSLIQYDGLGRTIQTTDPASQSTKQGWNALDHLVTVSDANGNTHRFEYNKAGQQIKETRPMGASIRYVFDAAGQLIDAGNNTRNYQYDVAGMMIEEIHKLEDRQTDQHVSYNYDSDRRLTGYKQQDGNEKLISSASYTKDFQGRDIQIRIAYGKADNSEDVGFTVEQHFNADGQLTSHTYPDGSIGGYSYNHGLLSKVAPPNQGVITFENYQWTRATKIQNPGASKTLVLDELQRVVGIEVRSGLKILANHQYKYDQAGNVIRINTDLGETLYEYDTLDRIKKHIQTKVYRI
ncbi:RHS repeat protein [Diaphorobacter sp. HDW4A]|uniref:RHS repeat protein n=1 Tax=Diaphorobacter sp. HDW4A TaxID=2714924 RepID=UPI0014096C5B|nr:RHS repeat protein [Diaphorobacter sp. HDW4A]QIL80191.1 RHS repeat protein [Diaphorobacter sp. HDW4A]